jgi:hypothetical protein
MNVPASIIKTFLIFFQTDRFSFFFMRFTEEIITHGIIIDLYEIGGCYEEISGRIQRICVEG